MAEEEARGSEAEVLAMKKHSPLLKWGGIAGALAGIFGLIHQVGPPVIGWVLSGRDANVEKLEAKLASCEGRVTKLEELADKAIDASEKRFQDNEVHAIQIEASVHSLRNEVRIRHNDMSTSAFASVGSGLLDHRARGARRPTRREVLEDVKNTSDARLQEARARRPEPQHKSLRKMMAQGVKPSDDPLFGLDGL